MDYRDNRQRWTESHQVVHFYAGQWCTFTPALTFSKFAELMQGVVGLPSLSGLEFGQRPSHVDEPI